MNPRRYAVAVGYVTGRELTPPEKLFASIIARAVADVQDRSQTLKARAGALRWLCDIFGRRHVIEGMKRIWPEAERRRRGHWAKGKAYHRRHRLCVAHRRVPASAQPQAGQAACEQRESAERA